MDTPRPLSSAAQVILDFLAVKQAWTTGPVRWETFELDLERGPRAALRQVGWSEAMIPLERAGLAYVAMDDEGYSIFTLTDQGRAHCRLVPAHALDAHQRPLKLGPRGRVSPLAERAGARLVVA